MNFDTVNNVLREAYMPQVAAMLDAEGRGVAYYQRLYALPNPPVGEIHVHLDDEELTRVGVVRQHSAGHWCAVADEAPELVLHRSEYWDVAADFLLAWPTLGPFQREVTLEVARLHADIAADMNRQLWGTGKVGEFTGIRMIVSPDVPPNTAYLLNPKHIHTEPAPEWAWDGSDDLGYEED